ncbi:hypothetical protein CL630_00350 [bacterium]|nr:hypothetical protein [bacterium]|tara:strand:- start:6646 stop:8907 length:2262 start_codon:yes stop_codon:yes gene_type:complete
MYLKKIELSGFKSFPRPSTLEFTTPITAIVGPNGSGKSNIAEAVRFVLGEQSIKSLRGKRGEDLIFNGTHAIPRQSKASVAVTFDNTKRIFDVDYDQVSLKRIMHRDSTSEYLINDSRMRLKDILETLSSAHIGASSHHIISQGEADRILLASLKERRGMIEDALGLKIYHYKKLESVRKLDKTEENLDQVEALKKEIEPHLAFLEKQVEKIKRAELLRKELADLCGVYLAQEESYLNQQKTHLTNKQEVPNKELQDIEKQISSLEATLKNAQTEPASEDILKIEQELQALRQKKDTVSRAFGRLEGVIEYERQKIKEVSEKSHTDENTSISVISIRKLQNDIVLYQKQADDEEDPFMLKVIIKKVQSAVNSFFTKYLTSTPANEQAVSLLQSTLKQKEEEKQNIEKELTGIQEKEQALHEEHIALRQKTELEHNKERESERTLFALQNKKTELISKIEVLKVKQEQLDTLEVNFKSFKEDARTLVGVEKIEIVLVPEGAEIESRQKQEERKWAIERIKIKIEEIGGGGSDVMEEYKEIQERNDFLKREIEDLRKSAESLNGLIKELEEKIDTLFKEGVRKINTRFQELFSLMFGGGKAVLNIIAPSQKRSKKNEAVEDLLSDEEFKEHMEQEEAEGIEIDVALPKKKVKGLQMLSGGERALTSIALIFAMTQVKPPPFLILDETDAALDETNSKKYGEMLKKLSGQTQLILITHNRETMTHAGVLYGITAVEGVSHLLSVKFDEAQELTGGV